MNDDEDADDVIAIGLKHFCRRHVEAPLCRGFRPTRGRYDHGDSRPVRLDARRAEELELLVDSKNGGRNFWAAVRVGRLERTFPSNQPYSHEYIDDVFLADSHITLGWFEWSPRAPRCIAEARSRLAYRVSLRRTSLCLTEPTAVGDPVCFNLRLDSAITGMIGLANLLTELQSLLAGRCGLAGTDRYGMLYDLSASRAFHLSVYSGFTCQRRVSLV